MRGSWNGGDSPKRGRRGGGRPGAGPSGSPFNFSADDDDRVDPVDLLAIRADDELLDALATGRSVGPAYTHGFDSGMDDGYTDDQQVLAMLANWRADVESEPFPELLSIDEASAAIVAGQRAARPRRRLMPVAAAAAVFVLALSGVAVAAGNAQPGDPLWGVSSVIDAKRAKSVEAAYRVDLALASAQQALAQGRVAEARQVLATVAPELSQVKDDQRKDELVRKSQNLMQTADGAHEGEKVDTDENGAKADPSRKHNDPRDKGKGDPSKENQPGSSTDPSSTRSSSEPGRPGNEDQSKNNPGQEKQGPDSGRPSPDSQQQQQSGQSGQQGQQGGQQGQQGQQGGQQGQQGQQGGQQGQQGQQGGQQNPDSGSKPPPSDKPAPDNKPPSDGGSKPPPSKPAPDNGDKPKPSGGDGKPSGGTNASNPSGGGSKPTSDRGGSSGAGAKGDSGKSSGGDKSGGAKGDSGKSSSGDKSGGAKGDSGKSSGGDKSGGKSKSDSEGQPDVSNAKPSFTPPGGALPGTGRNTGGDGPTT